jgi:hypothetical protein
VFHSGHGHNVYIYISDGQPQKKLLFTESVFTVKQWFLFELSSHILCLEGNISTPSSHTFKVKYLSHLLLVCSAYKLNPCLSAKSFLM